MIQWEDQFSKFDMSLSPCLIDWLYQVGGGTIGLTRVITGYCNIVCLHDRKPDTKFYIEY